MKENAPDGPEHPFMAKVARATRAYAFARKIWWTATARKLPEPIRELQRKSACNLIAKAATEFGRPFLFWEGYNWTRSPRDFNRWLRSGG